MLKEFVQFSVKTLLDLKQDNKGAKITLRTDCILCVRQYLITPFILDGLEIYLLKTEQKKHAEVKQLIILAKYVANKQNEYFAERLERSIDKYNSFEKPIFDRVEPLIGLEATPEQKKKIGLGATCTVLSGVIADWKGCFGGLVRMQIPTPDQIKAEFPNCGEFVATAYAKFMADKETDFYRAAIELVESVQGAEIEAIQKKIPQLIAESSDFVTNYGNELHNDFLRRYRILLNN